MLKMIRKQRWMMVVWFGALALPFLSLGCSAGYILKNGWYQMRLLRGARPIETILKKETLTSFQREQLELVLNVRSFAASKLFLSAGDNYTTANMHWTHYIHSVSASDPLAFKPYEWCFPIVGCVPYKGFFVEKDALAEFQSLKEQGYDVALRQVAGYSTLGYFKDPIWPQMLNRPKGLLAELIIHELSHKTIYFNGQSEFNESVANFIGKEGALKYVKSIYGEDSKEYRELRAYYRDEKRYEEWMWAQVQTLNKLYQSELSIKEKLQKKAQIFQGFNYSYNALSWEGEGFKRVQPSSFNNAHLMTFRLYHSNLHDFERLLHCSNNDWKVFIDVLRSFEAKQPMQKLQEYLKKQKSKPC